MQQTLKEGSPKLFFIIKVLNLVFGLMASALVALGIWLWRKFEAFDIVELAFLGIGILELILVMLVWTAKLSTGKLRCYLFLMFPLFLAEITATIIVFAVGPNICDRISVLSGQDVNQLRNNLQVVAIFTVANMIVMFLMMLLVKCYIGSLRDKNAEFEYKFITDEGDKITLAQKKEQIQQKTTDKWDKKRQEMEIKYGKPIG